MIIPWLMNENTKVLLPSVNIFKQDPNHYLYRWSDHYGAFEVASKYLRKKIGLMYPEEYIVWHHGLYGPWLNVHPLLISFGASDKSFKIFVARKDQEDFLKQNGFLKAKAIGMPIIYEETPKVDRIKNSLLIMPPHTLNREEKKDAAVYNDYIEYLKQFVDKYEVTFACIHNNCMRNGMWIDEFKSIGVDIISGAQTNDANALSRQLHLFKQFETVTTNQWGSHVAYALYCGAKVSISGPVVSRERDDYLKDASWSEKPHILDLILSEEVKFKQEDALKKFRVNPTDAVSDEEYGRFLVGYDLKLSPKELADQLIVRPSLKQQYYRKGKQMKDILFTFAMRIRKKTSRHIRKLRFKDLKGYRFFA
jgi:hypothetical protein